MDSRADLVEILTRTLFAAIRNRNSGDINQLIADGANLSAVNNNNQTPIEYARLLGQWNDVVTILQAAKQTDECDTFHFSKVLLDAVIVDRPVTEIKLFIEAGANLAVTNANDATPIDIAANNSNWDVVEAIANAKKTDAKDSYHYGNALHKLVRVPKHIKNQLATAEVLLKAGASPNWRTVETYNTPLHEAVITQNAKMIALLAKSSINPYHTNKAGQTPLELACSYGYSDCINALLKITDLTKVDRDRIGAVVVNAIAHAKTDIAETLIQAGASVTQPTEKDLNSCLHWAVKSNNPKLIRLLLEKNADQTAVNKDNKTPIELACQLGYWSCAQVLLEKEKNAASDPQRPILLHYEKALHYAIQEGNYAMVKLLLDQNAPCTSWNSEMGNIALYLAVKLPNEQTDILALLLEQGLDLEFRNGAGKTIRDIALQCENMSCYHCIDDFIKAKAKKKKYAYHAMLPMWKGKESEKTTEQYHLEARALWRALSENAIKADEIPHAVKGLKLYLQVILGRDLDELTKQRGELLRVGGSQSDSEIQAMTQLILILNTILNYSTSLTDIPYLPNQINSVELHIKDYREMLTMIREYEARLKSQLLDLKRIIKKAPLKVKNFLGNWVEGVPDTVKEINKKLDTITVDTKKDELFEIYTEVLDLISKIDKSSRRHETTAIFYADISRKMHSITFVESVRNAVKTQVLALPQSPPPSYASHQAMLYPLINAYAIHPPVSPPPELQPQVSSPPVFSSPVLQPPVSSPAVSSLRVLPPQVSSLSVSSLPVLPPQVSSPPQPYPVNNLAPVTQPEQSIQRKASAPHDPLPTLATTSSMYPRVPVNKPGARTETSSARKLEPAL